MLLFAAGCQMPARQLKPVLLDNEATVYLYLSPFPAESGNLRFSIESLAAVRSDGIEVPLAPMLPELTRDFMSRQRLLATAALPIGSYEGFSIKAAKAYLRGDEGAEAALNVAQEITRIDLPFEVKKQKALLVSLSLRYDASLKGVSFTPVFDAAVPPKPLNNLTGYVTNTGADTVTVFDKKAGVAVAAIQTGRGPAGIVVDQRRYRAYVALSGGDAIDVIDVTSNAVINTIPLTPGDAPRELALTPDGKILLSSNVGSSTVSIIDPLSFREADRLNVPNQPGAVMVDRTGNRAFIFNVLDNRISVLDLATRRFLDAAILTDSTPLRGEFNRKGDRLIVFQQWSPYLIYVNPFSFAEQKRVDAGVGVSWLKVDTMSDRLYVAKSDQPTLDIYDPFSLMPGDFIIAAGGVGHLAIDDDENNICLVLPEKRLLQIVNLVSHEVVREVDLGDSPYWVSVVGER